MHTVTTYSANTYSAPPATEPRTPIAVGLPYAADEPSRIHLPRPGRVTRPEAAAAPLEETHR